MNHHFTSEIKKRGLSALLCVLFAGFLFISAATAPGCSSENAALVNPSGSDNSSDFTGNTSHSDESSADLASYIASFDAFTEQVFCQEITANTINLHFTLAHPENYGIADHEVTLGDISMDAINESYARIENYLSTLNQFDKEKLPLSKQLTYDVLKKDFESSLENTSFVLYDELLAPSSGIHAQLPILLEEYLFYDKGDVEDYLALLASTKDYFAQVIAFEKEKVAVFPGIIFSFCFLFF